MSDDVRKILEAVARGEISPEEGEKLIKALQEREKEKEQDQEFQETFDEEEYVLREDETVEGDLVFSKKRVSIRGKVMGDLVLMNCDSFFSGEVEGDMVVIGGKVEFAGGKVREDLVLLGTKEKGEKPKVGGSEVRMSNNFLVRLMMGVVSPFVARMEITSKKKEGEKT